MEGSYVFNVKGLAFIIDFYNLADIASHSFSYVEELV